jgi:DNA-binding beta-propeller fold protein YncE
VGVAVDPDALWIVGRHSRDPAIPGETDMVYRYRRDGRLLTSVSVPLEVSAIAPDRGGVWVAVNLQSRVLRYDAQGRELRSVLTHGPLSELAFGAGSLWGSVPSIDSVEQVPVGGGAVATSVARNPAELAVADGRVFIAGNTDHTVAVVDAKTGRPAGEPLEVGLNPFAVTAGAGAVWVTGMGDKSLTRIDP